MAIFGSYIGKERSLMGESINVAILDTFVALVSGLIIFPACFTYQVEVGSGPSLIFVTLPNVFNNMPMGNLWGALFFVFMTFAAFSTVLAVFENILSCCMDMFGWSRKKACLINCLLLLVLSLPCALGFNLLAEVHPLGREHHVPGLGGLLSQQYFAASGLSDLCDLRGEQAGLGLEEVYGGSQRRPWMEGKKLDARLHNLCTSHHYHCPFCHRSCDILYAEVKKLYKKTPYREWVPCMVFLFRYDSSVFCYKVLQFFLEYSKINAD